MLAKMSVVLFGGDGFIGKSLAKKKLPNGIYYFDSPSSNILFDENLEWCVRKTVGGFLDILDRVKKTGEYLVYPSSATVYNKNTHYAKTKAVLEELVDIYNVKALGLRISAGYGPGEAHKGKYASVVYQWTKQMMNGESPVIFGDGTQTRDFIFETDIADNIERLANEGAVGIYDIGTGVNTSFNEVVETINKVLGTDIKPIYVPKPTSYVENTHCKPVACKVNLEQGIRKIVEVLHGSVLQPADAD